MPHLKSTLRLPNINTEACSGLTLSGVLHTAQRAECSTELTPKAWRHRTGQIKYLSAYYQHVKGFSYFLIFI